MSSSLKPGFSEEVLEASGQNLKLNERFRLSDILRIEYDLDTTCDVIKEYLKSVLPAEIIVLTDEPAIEIEEYVLIYPDYSGIVCTRSIKLAINRFKNNYFSFYHDKPKSYCLISLAEAVSKYEGGQDLQEIYEEATNLLTLIKLKSDVIRFLYTLSEINTRVLMKKCNEAKLLFTGYSMESSLDDSRVLKSNLDKGKVSDYSESYFEYSVSSDSKESKQNYDLTDNQFISDTVFSEELENCGGKDLESEEINCERSNSPPRMTKLLGVKTRGKKSIYNFIESQIDSTSFGMDSEKYFNTSPGLGKTMEFASMCYRCESCVIG